MVVTPANADLNPSNQQIGKAAGKSLPKAKAVKARAQPPAAKTEHALEFEDLMANNVDYEELESYEMIEQTVPDVSHLEQRMLHLETALTRVIQHLENQGAKSSEPSEV